MSNAKSTRPVGFINKGNTCYGNSILLGFYQGLIHSSICTFAMTSQFLMMKKIMSTNLHHTLYIPFLQQSLSFSQDLPNIFMVCKGVLSFQRLSLGVTTPHIIPAFLWELRLLTQFSGITTLQSLILEK